MGTRHNSHLWRNKPIWRRWLTNQQAIKVWILLRTLFLNDKLWCSDKIRLVEHRGFETLVVITIKCIVAYLKPAPTEKHTVYLVVYWTKKEGREPLSFLPFS